MKNNYISIKSGWTLLMALLPLVFGSCRDEDSDTASNILTVSVDVEGIRTGLQNATRGTIPAEEGETTVNDLYLLFFEYRSDGSGEFVDSREVTEPELNGTYSIVLDGKLSDEQDYVILAAANTDRFVQPSGPNFPLIFGNLTEKEALEKIHAFVEEVGTDESDDSWLIEATTLPMSARVIRNRYESSLTIKLIRGVVRFDVANKVKEQYDLVSVSIWGAALQTPFWERPGSFTPEHSRRFYGIKRDSEFPDIVGGLYAFENYSPAPVPADETTTCLIVGMKKAGESLETTTYYRINVHPDRIPQNLLRNHVYKVQILQVTSEGEKTEYEAWKQRQNRLVVSINAWNLDDDGLVLTDGTNTLMIPVKRVRLDPKGDQREYTIFTQGTGTPTLTRNSFKENGITGIDIFLDSVLRVKAAPMPEGQTELRGSVEISFGSLRGTITFIQSPSDDHFLTLSRYELPEFSAFGRTWIANENPILVTASGEWTAQLYNPDEGNNPGFSFESTGEPVTELHSGSNPFGNRFRVYTTGDNPMESITRHGFMVVSLDADPENHQYVLVLTQAGRNEIKITPEFSRLRFTSGGVPFDAEGRTEETGYELTIDPGTNNGEPNHWEVSMPPESRFEAVRVGSENRFIVRAKGSDNRYPHLNLHEYDLTDVCMVRVGETMITIPIIQSRMEIKLSDRRGRVPKTGGRIPEVTVDTHPLLQWSAEFVEQPADTKTGHKGYFFDESGENLGTSLSGHPQSEKLRVGFNKIYYPDVEREMQAEVLVWLTENPAVSTTLIITQEAVKGHPATILDVKSTSYGSLSGDHFEHYPKYLKSNNMYGWSGTVKTIGNPIITSLGDANSANDPGVISDDYVYLHVGGQPQGYTVARHMSVVNWWKKDAERITVVLADARDNSFFKGGTRTSVLSERGYGYKAPTSSAGLNVKVINASYSGGDHTNSPIMRYLFRDGPFSFNNGDWLHYAAMTFYLDGISSGVDPNSEPFSDGAIPVLVDGSGTPMLVFDPKGRMVYCGEGQFFHGNTTGYENPPVTASSSDHSKFLGNVLAYVILSAQYGTHFTELFYPGNETLYEKGFK